MEAKASSAAAAMAADAAAADAVTAAKAEASAAAAAEAAAALDAAAATQAEVAAAAADAAAAVEAATQQQHSSQAHERAYVHELDEERAQRSGSKLVRATFAAGNWHVAEGRLGCMAGVARTIVGHVSINMRQPSGPADTLYIGDEVESVRVWYDPALG